MRASNNVIAAMAILLVMMQEVIGSAAFAQKARPRQPAAAPAGGPAAGRCPCRGRCPKIQSPANRRW